MLGDSLFTFPGSFYSRKKKERNKEEKKERRKEGGEVVGREEACALDQEFIVEFPLSSFFFLSSPGSKLPDSELKG